VLLSPCSLFFSISLAASANSFCLPPPFPSVYLSRALTIYLALFHFSCTDATRRDGCVRMHACKRRRQHASYVPRKRNPYIHALTVFFFLSLSFLQHNQPVRTPQRSRCNVRAKVGREKADARECVDPARSQRPTAEACCAHAKELKNEWRKSTSSFSPFR